MTQALVPVTERPTRGPLREFLVAVGATSVALALPSAMLTSRYHSDDGWPLMAAMAVLAFASYPMSRASNVFAQLFARAIWWQGLAFGLVLGVGHACGQINGPISSSIPMYLVGGALALAAAGRVGLNFESAQFAPAAFRRSLSASLVMAMADTIALLFYAGIVLVDHSMRIDTMLDAATFAGSAAVMAVAIGGLYRMKVWGLALNLVANVVIAAFALTGVFDIPEVIGFGLAATALAQLLLPIPLLKRMVSNRS